MLLPMSLDNVVDIFYIQLDRHSAKYLLRRFKSVSCLSNFCADVRIRENRIISSSAAESIRSFILLSYSMPSFSKKG